MLIMDRRTRVTALLGSGAATLTLAAVTLSGACAGEAAVGSAVPSTSAPSPSSTAATATCTPIEPTAFEPAPAAPFTEPQSTLVVELAAPLRVVEAELDRRIPKSLGAASGVPIGRAGEVSYHVGRGHPKVTLEGDELVVVLPITAAVEVCKPIASLCPVYGACQPNLAATVRLPLRLSADWTLPRPTIAVAVTRGCRIAGFDVTGEVRKQAARGRAQARRRIERAMPDLRRELELALRELRRPVQLGDGLCAEVVPERLRQHAVRQDEGVVHLALSVDGLVRRAPCRTTLPTPRLPELVHASEAPGDGHVRVTRLHPWDSLALQRRGRAPEPITVVTSSAGPDGQRLALDLTLGGAGCGRLWVVDDPRVDDRGLRLGSLRAVRGASAQARALVPRLGPLVDPSIAPDPIAAAIVSAAASAPFPIDSLAADIAMTPAPTMVQATADGLAVTAVQTGRVRLRFAEPSR
jgi:Domain of unknown function (DUF4403)